MPMDTYIEIHMYKWVVVNKFQPNITLLYMMYQSATVLGHFNGIEVVHLQKQARTNRTQRRERCPAISEIEAFHSFMTKWVFNCPSLESVKRLPANIGRDS